MIRTNGGSFRNRTITATTTTTTSTLHRESFIKRIMTSGGINMTIVCTLTLVFVFQILPSVHFHLMPKRLVIRDTNETHVPYINNLTQNVFDVKRNMRYEKNKTNNVLIGNDNRTDTPILYANNNNNNTIVDTTSNAGKHLNMGVHDDDNAVTTIPRQRLIVLMGILSTDTVKDQKLRRHHRTLYQQWTHDARFCSLSTFKSKPLSDRYECDVIYTFVIGAAHPNTTTSPVLLDNSRPMEVSRPTNGISIDLHYSDMMFLNIRENMNEGKSQTWMYYGSKIAQEYDLDYVVKCDTDSIFFLHKFLPFAYKNMPPAPYNSMMYIGTLRDKAFWNIQATKREKAKSEHYFAKEFDGIHLYVAGQIYIVSTDLAKYIGEEAMTVSHGNCSYCAGHEDHDISSIAFHSPEPIKLVVIGNQHKFWIHPAKQGNRWNAAIVSERVRIEEARS